MTGGGDVVEVDLFQFLHALQALGNGLEVGEHTAEPAVVHVGHAHALSVFLDGFLGLLLGADEQDVATVGDGFLHEVEGNVDVCDGLRQVDYVDAVTFGEDEALHLGVPATGLVPEVDAAFQKLTHGHNCHGCSFRGVRCTRLGARCAQVSVVAFRP